MVVQELDQLLRGGFVSKVHQPLPRETVLRIRLPHEGEKKLVLSADAKLGRIHLTDLKIPNPPVPPRFCSYLRAHFQGARVLAIEAETDDRVVRIVGRRGPEEARSELELILELLGRDSNIILVDRKTHTILDCLHHLDAKETASRVVMPGTPYRLPPRRQGLSTADGATSLEILAPGIAVGPGGKTHLTVAATGSDDELFPTLNAAADAFFASRLQQAMLDAQRRALTGPVRSRIRSLEKRLIKIEGDAARLEQFVARSEEGELLKANLNKARRGMDHVVVQDWSSGKERAIGLDPSLDAVENMQRLFKNAAKGKRGLTLVSERREETDREIRALKDQLFLMESAQDLTELEAIAGHVDAEPVAREPGDVGSRDERKKAQSGYFRQYTAPSGRLVLVGRSSRGNEFLLRQKADKEDLWFHVKDWPGAHVLLRTAGRTPPPPEDLEFAAALTVTFSGARGKGKVEVMMAQVKDVGRPKGGAPGQVTVKRFRTIRAEG